MNCYKPSLWFLCLKLGNSPAHRKGAADFFITCDDKIIKIYKGLVNVQNPIDFVINILRKEENDEN